MILLYFLFKSYTDWSVRSLTSNSSRYSAIMRSCTSISRRFSDLNLPSTSLTVPRSPAARFKNEMLSGLNLCFAMSIPLRIASNGKLLLLTSRRRALSGTLRFFGMCPLAVKLIVKNGFGLLIAICSTWNSSLSSMCQIRNPLSSVSPWFCCTVEPAYRMRPSLSIFCRLWMSPSIAKSNSSKIETSSSPAAIVQFMSVLQLLMDPWYSAIFILS